MDIDVSRSALIAVDIQNDFCPGGALAVADGDAIIEPVNAIAVRFAKHGGRVVATQDWHPRGHVSFASAHPGANIYDVIPVPGADSAAPASIDQVLWPDHCVISSQGAAFHPKLDLDPINLILRKGFRQDLDSYSAFFENDRSTRTGLDGFLKGLSIRTVFMCGLATDYCVLYSTLDAARLGYETVLITDAVRGVGAPEGSVEAALDLMRSEGVQFIESRSLL